MRKIEACQAEIEEIQFGFTFVGEMTDKSISFNSFPIEILIEIAEINQIN